MITQWLFIKKLFFLNSNKENQQIFKHIFSCFVKKSLFQIIAFNKLRKSKKMTGCIQKIESTFLIIVIMFF